MKEVLMVRLYFATTLRILAVTRSSIALAVMFDPPNYPTTNFYDTEKTSRRGREGGEGRGEERSEGKGRGGGEEESGEERGGRACFISFVWVLLIVVEVELQVIVILERMDRSLTSSNIISPHQLLHSSKQKENYNIEERRKRGRHTDGFEEDRKKEKLTRWATMVKMRGREVKQGEERKCF